MKDSGVNNEKLKKLIAKDRSEQINTGEVSGIRKVSEVITVIGRVIYRLRKVFMSIPVIYYALKLAAYNGEYLPEMVGINLQSNGEYAEMIAREAAVMGPLAVTAACLVLMFFSKKSLYPWIISIFSLILPLLILFTNNYPA